MRAKLEVLCEEAKAVREWSGKLAQEWMEAQPESAGTLYIDGHVRVYNGKLTQLPRRYIARQRLCLRGTTDYWVNAMDGQPFFAVTQAADPGWRRGEGLECMLFIARSLELRALPYALNRPPRAAASFNEPVERMAAGGVWLPNGSLLVCRHRPPSRWGIAGVKALYAS